MALRPRTGSSGSVVLQFRPFSFDSAEAPMLKSAELLGFWALHCPIFLGNNSWVQRIHT